MLTTSGGMGIRTPLSTTRTIGRNTQGVRLIKLDEGDVVSSLAKLPADEIGDSARSRWSSPSAHRRMRAGDPSPPTERSRCMPRRRRWLDPTSENQAGDDPDLARRRRVTRLENSTRKPRLSRVRHFLPFSRCVNA